MSATIAFLAQPIQMLVHKGQVFADEVVHVLQEWAASEFTQHVRAERRHEIYALSPDPRASWNLVVIMHHGRSDGGGPTHPRANVCAVDFGGAEAALEHFAPLVMADRISAVVEVSLGKIDPRMLLAVAHGQGYGGGASLVPRSPAAGAARQADSLFADVDATGRRWASSNARSQFKALLEAAQKQPQVIERDGDDLLVVSRSYLREFAHPTGARAMARHYRANALSTEGMAEPRRVPLDPLGELPELGAA